MLAAAVGIEYEVRTGLKGDAVWGAMAAGSWGAGGWDPRLLEACLCRSQTLAQPATLGHRYPTPAQVREWVKEPRAFRVEYADGLRATVLMVNGLVQDFTLAARLKGAREPLSTLFHLPPNPNVVYSAALMSRAEEVFVTGKAPYPVERTLGAGTTPSRRRGWRSSASTASGSSSGRSRRTCSTRRRSSNRA